MKLLTGLVALFFLIAFGFWAIEFGYGRDPYLVGKLAKEHPELSFSRYAIGDTLGKPTFPSIVFRSEPKPMSKAECDWYIANFDELNEDCPYSDQSGLSYFVHENKISAVVLEPKEGKWTYPMPFGRTYERPLPFDITAADDLKSIRKRFEKAGIKVEDGPYDRQMGFGFYWPLDPSKELIMSDYARLELNEAGQLSFVRVGYWDGD